VHLKFPALGLILSLVQLISWLDQILLINESQEHTKIGLLPGQSYMLDQALKALLSNYKRKLWDNLN